MEKERRVSCNLFEIIIERYQQSSVRTGFCPPGHEPGMSEGHSPGKLNDTGQIVLPGHLAKLPAPSLWRIELCSVEQVEELTPELKAISTIRAKLRVFKGGKVEVLLSVGTDVRLGPRICTIT